MANLEAKEYINFENIKYVDENGSELWYARELADVLEYTQWRNFAKVIDKAMLSCKNSGYDVDRCFAEVSKTSKMPNGGVKQVIDYEITRYACYLIVQNGDPRKEVIALGQTYFAIQTRRQEVADYFNQLDEENKRLVVRGDIKQWNQMLAETAHNAGVITNEEYATFQNAGYIGLYGGLTVAGIHSKKGLKENEKILNFMSSTELIANLFRISQTEEKLKKDGICTADAANETHFIVGSEVRSTIKRVGGTLPEDIPTPTRSITEIEREQIKKLKKSKNKLMLDE
ncbi:DNA damage-inducible protein D [Clostridium sp.]|uniref:DNA damage-inducible protein D n=1 Tax=Clostridium sp. TaxID=1506 RepID=UPI003D6D3AA1